jgi:hypothetical protein
VSTILRGAGGDTAQDQVPRRVISMFWDRGRAHYGDQINLGCLITGFKDGTAVTLKLYESDDPDTVLKEISATASKGKATGTYTVDFKDSATQQHDSYDLYFIVEIAGEPWSKRGDCPVLVCDADPPGFSG